MDPSVLAKIESIRKRFGQTLDAKLQAIEAHASAAKSANDVQELVALTKLAHKLYGTAGTMGFDEVGERAARLESRAHAIIDRRALNWTDFDAALKDLADAVAAARS